MDEVIEGRYRHPARASAVIGLAIVMLSACSRPVATNGHVVDPQDLQKVSRPNVSREDVQQTLGSPSTVSVIDGETWYYISRESRTFAFFRPEILEQRVIVIAFNDTGYVQKVDTFGLERSREVTPVDRETPTTGAEISVFDQILGNIGRFNKDEGAQK